jgi:hypothetical protein
MAFTKPEDVRYWITRMDDFKANLRKGWKRFQNKSFVHLL